MTKIIIYCDGGSRGNPGPAALGAVIEIKKGKIAEQKEYSQYLGNATNNESEYQAVVFALKKVKQLIGNDKAGKSHLEIKADSELLIKQLNGEYKIKEEKLQSLFMKIWNLKLDFAKVEFVQIPREENKKADLLVNKELNNQNRLNF